MESKVLCSPCCVQSLMNPIAWYGHFVKYKCIKCGMYWNIDTKDIDVLSQRIFAKSQKDGGKKK